MPLTLDEAAVLLQRATVWQQEGDLKRADQAYRQVLAADPANPDALNLLAIIHHERGEREIAIRMLRAAIKIKPNQGRYWNNLAVVLSRHGRAIESVAALRQAEQLAPHDEQIGMALIFATDLHAYGLPSIRMADRRAFNARHCAALTAAAEPHTNDRDPNRRLRVGYVSGDFRGHSAAMCFEVVLEGHDHAAVETYLYTVHPGPGDVVTERCKQYADTWREVEGLSDEALAAQVRSDQIDVLVDLSGYSGGNRLLAFAHKPAPVQLTAWGHATGTGLDAMDYLLADDVTCPPEHESLYHERVLRLPCMMAYRPDAQPPTLVPPPAIENQVVTFGYLGRANKTNEAVLAVWAEILHRVPHSRLILKSDDYTDDSYRALITDFLVSLRIGTPRFEFRGATDHLSHLANYGDVDIALDTFPQCGGITTLEACMMGVPTVTLLGDYINGRASASILATIGQGGVVAVSREQYVALAVHLARLRRSLRDRMALRKELLASVLCDPKRYAAHVESLYRTAWQQWVSGHAEASKAS